ncbi:MAG: hypothetical protein IJB59_08950 [Oscillospiraceae bacterium]|nr:hypothetical protein [Oscillospiraceae bacterium]
MGYSILELVLRRLREAGFAADVAYPGQKFPRISDTVAAVHIERVDRANLTVTVEISILCPADMGGTACEVEALRATEILRWSGAVCVQNGCTYDGVAQVYVVSVLATFTGVTEAEDCMIWQGFYCYIDGMAHRFAVEFTADNDRGGQAEYEMGQKEPTLVSFGSNLWKIQLVEMIPCGSPELPEPDGAFELKIVTEQTTEIYTGCRWLTEKREISKQGLRLTRTGAALRREVE